MAPVNLRGVRARYARKLQRKGNLRSELLIRAFAETPREHYLGPGPWPILKKDGYHTSRMAHPRVLYDDVLVGIIPERWFNNGQPSGLARWFDALELKRNEHVVHIGCGTGYYTAILAHVVGTKGKVRAFEIQPELAERAKRNLAHLYQVEVTPGDGSKADPGPADAIFVNAGANFPVKLWLDALRERGRLLFPLITSQVIKHPQFGRFGDAWKPVGSRYFAFGGLMLLVRRGEPQFSAKVVSSVKIFPCFGAIDKDADRRAALALLRSDYAAIHSRRRDEHEVAPSCWLHTGSACISTAI
jgi:protein-L-isoaspartate(D-aspartate) O-methyltransferase